MAKGSASRLLVYGGLILLLGTISYVIEWFVIEALCGLGIFVVIVLWLSGTWPGSEQVISIEETKDRL